MAEYPLPACDLCYSRKVKCDRQRNCANCVDAGVPCQRFRPGRASKKFSTGIPAENVFRLERAPSESNLQSEHTNISVAVSGQEGNTTAKRRKLEDHRDGNPRYDSNPPIAQDNSIHHAQQAKLVIQIEVDGRKVGRRHLSEERWKILQSAVKLVDRMSRGEHLDFQESLPPGGAGRENLDADIPQSPPAELLYMLLPEPVICDGSFSRIRWPDHISDRALERMMTSLLDNECGEQLFHQYSICIYVKGMFYLYQLARKSTNPSVKKQLHKTKRTYEAAALRALKHINLISTPSLSLLQALISAALLMQHMTNISQCWVLNSYAARQIISLGYHKSCEANSQGGYSDEIQSAVCWCFYLDRTTSALLMRSPSLPEVNAPPTDFMTNDTSSPYNSLLLILLDLAKAQGSLLDISLSDEDKSKSRIFEIFQGIQEQMDTSYSNLQENQRSLSDPAVFEWRAADFSYYSIYADMLRARLGYDASQATHVDCLLYSRRALRAFLFLQENVDHMPGFNDPEPSFLTWTIALYPVTPFFVVFCNIIATSDAHDYRLVRHIIRGLSQFKSSPFLTRLLNLLTSLLELCDPLFRNTSDQTRQSGMEGEDHTSIDVPLTHNLNNAANDPSFDLENGLDQPTSSNSTYMGGEPWGHGVGDPAPYPLADDLMWQFVNSQFPYSWLESDILVDTI